MKNLFFVFFFGIVVGTGTCFSQKDINQRDDQGQRHGLWKKYYPESDQLRYKGKFEHGKETGTFKFYCEDCKSQPSVIKKFNRKNNLAEVKYFTRKGNLLSEGMMDGKERVGQWIYYHKNSDRVMSRESYKNGKLHGKKTTYYPNGQITEEIEYKEGIKDGKNIYYSPSGVLLKELLYRNGTLHGRVIYYDATGNVIIEGHYNNGQKKGLWKYYNDGDVVVEETFPKKNRE